MVLQTVPGCQGRRGLEPLRSSVSSPYQQTHHHTGLCTVLCGKQPKGVRAPHLSRAAHLWPKPASRTHTENALTVSCSDSPYLWNQVEPEPTKTNNGKKELTNVSKSWQKLWGKKKKAKFFCQNSNYKENISLKGMRSVQTMLQMSQTLPQIWGPLIYLNLNSG